MTADLWPSRTSALSDLLCTISFIPDGPTSLTYFFKIAFLNLFIFRIDSRLLRIIDEREGVNTILTYSMKTTTRVMSIVLVHGFSFARDIV